MAALVVGAIFVIATAVTLIALVRAKEGEENPEVGFRTTE